MRRALLHLEKFFSRHRPAGRTLLLAISGGVDSMVLFHLLRACREKFSYALHAVHLDHGWRRESADEREFLAQQLASYEVPLHRCALTEALPTSNLENFLRNKRWNYFKKIYQQIDADALLLGHHEDDRVETSVKRIFEGSCLWNWQTLVEESVRFAMRVWRPLLGLRKQQIVELANRERIHFFVDSTNSEQRFLRARMRQQLIPYLEKRFGKKIHRNLSRLADEANMLQSYLRRRLAATLERGKTAPVGFCYDLSSTLLDPYEWHCLVRFACQKHQIVLSRELLGQLAAALQKGAAQWSAIVAGQQIAVARGILFFLPHPRPLFTGCCPLQPGEKSCGQWRYQITRQRPLDAPFSGWRALWQDGGCRFSLPAGRYLLAAAAAKMPFLAACSLGRWWQKQKVPRFLQACYPVVIGENKRVVLDLLTGKSLLPKGGEEGFAVLVKRATNRS